MFFFRMDLPSTFVIELAETVKEVKGKSPEELNTFLPGRLGQLSLKYIRETFDDSVVLPDTAENDLKYLAGIETIAKVEDEDTIKCHVKTVVGRFVEALVRAKKENIVKRRKFKFGLAKLGLESLQVEFHHTTHPPVL